MVATMRMVKTATLILALLFGSMISHGVSAEKEPTSLPMSVRVKFQRSDCFDGGGRTFAEHYTYDANGAIESIRTVCHGGSEDGRNCVNTASTVDCTKPFMPVPHSRVDIPTDGVLQD
jgi:hypothetical protein